MPNLALKCSVQSDCHLDINYLLATQTTEQLKRANTTYLSVDVYFLCEHQSVLGEYHSTCMEGWYTSVTDLLIMSSEFSLELVLITECQRRNKLSLLSKDRSDLNATELR